MKVIVVRNVQEALPNGMRYLQEEGVRRKSRAGDVIVSKVPVTTLYKKPKERVIFWTDRDANPFFHFMEGLWMLAGRNDVAWISQFSSNIAQFSDDGETFHGAYGYRWINHFSREIPPDPNIEYHGGSFMTNFNQLEEIVNMLKANPDDRRCVLQMWDCERDLGRVGKDVPCNTQIYFKIAVDGRLDMTVLNRSNDIIWGAYGANAVHMSMLQEFMAAAIGVEVGCYWQVSNDYHAYVDVFEKHKGLLQFTDIDILALNLYIKNPMTELEVTSFPMVNTWIEEWQSDLKMFMQDGPTVGFKDVFFRKVVVPIWNSWFAWKDKEDPERGNKALTHIQDCIASDWRLACEEWLMRRIENGNG